MPQYLPITSDPAIGYAGQIAEAGAPKYARSYNAESNGRDVVAGAPVKAGTDPDSQVEPFEAADVPDTSMFVGVVVLDPTREQASTPIADGEPVSVLRLGKIYMEFSEAVTRGEMVAIVLATGLLKGYAEGTAAGSIPTGEVVLPGLRIDQTIAAAGVARVEVNLFGAQPAATVGSL